jgi:glycine oxidase
VTLREHAGSARLETDSGRTVLRLEGGEILRGATFVVSAGAWSGSVAAALLPGAEAARAPAEEHPGLPIRPIRGQAVALKLDRELGPNLRFRPRDMERDYHIITREGATRWVGSTVEDVGFDGRVTEAGTSELLRAARDALGDVTPGEVTDRWAGLRPQARRPGGPFLGPLFSAADVWLHCAHYRSGILLAPLTAKLLCDGMLGEDAPQPVPGGGPIPRAAEIIDALRPTPSTAE